MATKTAARPERTCVLQMRCFYVSARPERVEGFDRADPRIVARSEQLWISNIKNLFSRVLPKQEQCRWGNCKTGYRYSA